MEQTALQWFINGLIESNYITKDSFIMNEFIEEAKTMEKQQIMKAVYDGMGANFDPNMGRAEEYFKQTYNK